MNSPNGATNWGYLFQCLSLGGSGGISNLHFPQTASAYTALDNSSFFTPAALTGVPLTCLSYRLPCPSALQSSPGGARTTVPFFSVNTMSSITLSMFSPHCPVLPGLRESGYEEGSLSTTLVCVSPLLYPQERQTDTPPHLGLCRPIFLPSAEDSIYMVCMFRGKQTQSHVLSPRHADATPAYNLLWPRGGTLCSWGGPPLMEMYPSVPHKDGGHSGRPPHAPKPHPWIAALHSPVLWLDPKASLAPLHPCLVPAVGTNLPRHTTGATLTTDQ